MLATSDLKGDNRRKYHVIAEECNLNRVLNSDLQTVLLEH